MNGYERIWAALKGEKPDQTPVMLHNFMMAAREAGVSMSAYRENPKTIAEVFIKSVEKYGYDGILVDIDTVTLAGAVGVPVDFPLREPARTGRGLLKQLSEIGKLKAVNIENYKYVQVWLESVRLIKEHFNNEVFVRGNCDQAPFSLASMMRGTQEWMLDLLMEEPGKIRILLDYCTGISLQFIRLMAQTGCDMVSNGDSPAGPEMISPEMYREYALPYEKILADEAHRLKLPYTLHICGNTESILESMLETGADALELDYKTSSDAAFNLLNEHTCLIGNIDPSGVLALGSADLVKRTTLELLEIYRPSNRFILNAGCAIPAETPPDNLKMMIQTAREFKR
jgi:uroporphyrinogen decarboxylase